MNVRDHLASLPVLFVNVDGHTERERRFREETGIYFKEVHRISAHPIHDITADANDFVARIAWSKVHGDQLGYFAKFPYIYTVTKFNAPTARAREYACTRSLVLSTLMALKTAKEAGYERFMICDDDAAPRPQVIDEMPSELPIADIRVWGGAYGSGGLRKDSDRFVAGEAPHWVNVKRNPTRFFSQAYELTQTGADAMIDAITYHFNAVDLMWWYGFAKSPTDTFTLQPSAFTQIGESVRVVKHNPRTREGATVR